jgi:hypothetical protein
MVNDSEFSMSHPGHTVKIIKIVYAECECGWQGPARTKDSDAGEDLKRHFNQSLEEILW